jgi:hypothetical protein
MASRKLVGKHEHSIVLTSLFVSTLSVWGCSAQPERATLDSPGVSAVSTEALGQSAYGLCSGVSHDMGWANAFIPDATADTGVFTAQFTGFPRGGDDDGAPLIDGVLGLSDGPAHAFTDLGPIVRFNPSGNIDARDGDAYVGSFPYQTGIGPFEFKLSVDLSTRRYSALVRHLDAIDKPWEVLADDIAFRSEQSGMTRINNIAWFVDGGANEQLEAPCNFSYSAPETCMSADAGAGWRTRAFAAQTQPFRLEFRAMAATGIDAVVGASHGEPGAFTDLAAIVRFRPDGTFDARNGGNYAADATVQYQAGISYRIAMDIDPTAGTYSAGVYDSNDEMLEIAHNYAFRSEQAGVSSFDYLGQFVDAEAGTLEICSPVIIE